MHRLSSRVFLVFLGAIPLIIAQTVAPYPATDCSSGSFYMGYLACNNNVHQCCAGGAFCCAGGCCPIDATCVGQGTVEEACCPVTDKTLCGFATPSTSNTTNCSPSSPGPSVQCVGVDSDWYCPKGSVCEYSTGGCLNFPAGSCSQSVSAVNTAPSPSSTHSSTMTRSSSVAPLVSSSSIVQVFSSSSSVSHASVTTSPTASMVSSAAPAATSNGAKQMESNFVAVLCGCVAVMLAFD